MKKNTSAKQLDNFKEITSENKDKVEEVDKYYYKLLKELEEFRSVSSDSREIVKNLNSYTNLKAAIEDLAKDNANLCKQFLASKALDVDSLAIKMQVLEGLFQLIPEPNPFETYKNMSDYKYMENTVWPINLPTGESNLDIIFNNVGTKHISLENDAMKKLVKQLIDNSVNAEIKLKSYALKQSITYEDMMIYLYNEAHPNAKDILLPQNIYNDKLEAQINYFLGSGEVIGNTLFTWLGVEECDI